MHKLNNKFLSTKHGLIIVTILLAAGVLAALEITNTTYILHNKKVPTVIPSTKSSSGSGITKQQAKGTTTSGNSTAAESSNTKLPAQQQASTDSTAVLIKPYGNFVSNHRPGLNDTGTAEQSACNTNAGAKCYIQFKNLENGTVTKLPTQTVGVNGAAIWNWNADILTKGSWEVTAVANLGDQTSSTADATRLEIQ